MTKVEKNAEVADVTNSKGVDMASVKTAKTEKTMPIGHTKSFEKVIGKPKPNKGELKVTTADVKDVPATPGFNALGIVPETFLAMQSEIVKLAKKHGKKEVLNLFEDMYQNTSLKKIKLFVDANYPAPVEKGSEKAQNALPESKATSKTAPKNKKESNIELAKRLLRQKADEKTILLEFTKIYKEKKNISDKTYIKERMTIYIEIAKKTISEKKK